MSTQNAAIQKSQNLESKSSTDWGPYLVFKYRWNENKLRNELESISFSDNDETNQNSADKFDAVMKKTVGTENSHYGLRILHHLAHGLTDDSYENRLNQMALLLPTLKPQDETEAMLLGQFLALQESGFRCLRQGNGSENFYQMERLIPMASKLLRTANETMQTLLKYRCKGQQTVQVVHLYNTGQAIVAQNLSHHIDGEGTMGKNRELNPLDHCGAVHSEK